MENIESIYKRKTNTELIIAYKNIKIDQGMEN